MSRSHKGPSESQANADALARRDAPFSAASGASFSVNWDWHRREPSDLREAERMVRRAYSDEVPSKLHEGPDSIGEGGTPKMTTRAEGYLFGSAGSNDAKRDPLTGQLDAVGWYHAPFRAHLDNLAHGDEASRKRAAIVSHIAIGGQGPQQAAITEGIPSWAAKLVAEDVLRAFLRGLSDLKLNAKRQAEAVA